MSRRGSLYFHESDLEQKLVALVRAAVHLAIIRHGLHDPDDDLADALGIGADVANAVRGIDTCAGKPIPEWSVIFRKSTGRPRKITPDQVAEIKRRVKAGEKHIALAAEFKISEGHLRLLAKKESA